MMVLLAIVSVAAPAVCSGITVFNAAAENLIINGDFSTNSVRYTRWPGYSVNPNPEAPTGWMNDDNSHAGVNGADTTVGSPFAPASLAGVRDFAFLQSAGTTISQTVATTAGKTYTLTYAAAGRGSDVEANHDRLQVSITNAQTGKPIIAVVPAITRAEFKAFIIKFTAVSTSTMVKFRNASPATAVAGGTVDISDVILAATPAEKRATAEAFEYSPVGLTPRQINRQAEALL